jgi:hypothetical protein
MQQTMDSNFTNGSLCFLTWSKIRNGRNDFWGRLRYSPQVFTRRQAEGIGKCIAHVLEKIPEETPVEMAVKELIRLHTLN